MKSIQIFFIALFIYYCAAHSWVACTNYQPTNSQNSIIYDNSRCAGFPRNWNTYNGNDNFGQDTGYNFQGEGCGSQNKRGSPVSAAYSTKYPMATWVAGQRTCIAWPSKNHVAAKTTNQYIPDNGLTLFRSAADQDADPSQATFKNNKIITFGPHVNGQIDYLGYQNCSNFDNNNDKALCLGCFQVPNLAAGLYTIQWYWIFNEGSAPYTTCFDVRVVSNGGQVTDPCSGIVCKNGGSCSNGACTCVGGYTGTFCDVAPGQTIPPSPTQAPGTLPGGDDSILDVQWPSTFGSNSFQVYMKYNAQGDRALVIDILKLPNYDFYGKGSVYVTKGQATATITITPQGTLNSGDSYVLKGWIVEKSTFDKDPSVAFTAELDKIIRSITYQSGATPTLPPTTTTGSVTSTTTTGASASTSSAALYSFNVIALFIILAAYFF